jgi:hypothetical protein
MCESWHQTKPFDSIPSTNRWTNGTDEYLGGTISTSMGERKTEQLGENVTNGGILTQLLVT